MDYVSAENIIYGKRKSIFKKYNDATYEEEDVDSIAVLNLDFYERDFDDETDTSSIVDSPTIGFAVLISTDLKDDIQNQTDLMRNGKKKMILKFSVVLIFQFLMIPLLILMRMVMRVQGIHLMEV
jgi:hypothetical protein